MIAEVHHIKLASGATGAPAEDANNLAAEAAKAPGSVQLLSLMDTSTGEGLGAERIGLNLGSSGRASR
jgi:hypothetical protein